MDQNGGKSSIAPKDGSPCSILATALGKIPGNRCPIQPTPCCPFQSMYCKHSIGYGFIGCCSHIVTHGEGNWAKRTGHDPSRTDLDPSTTDLDPSRTDLDPSRTDLDPSTTDLDPSRTDLDRSRTDLDPSRTDLDPSRTDLDPSRLGFDTRVERGEERTKQRDCTSASSPSSRSSACANGGEAEKEDMYK
eukprot:6178895-Pleurochrysis_carterae.AAC.2